MAKTTLQILSEAMRGYVQNYLARYPARPFVLDDAMIDRIRKIRHETRVAECGGGMCHLVTEELQGMYGIGRLAVAYHSMDGEVICGAHLVNVLEDGSVLDGTADQFAEGHDVRLVRPDDPEYGRYKIEFDADYNPGLYPEELKDFAPVWTGEPDCDQQDRLIRERGHGWWVADDPSLLLAHYAERLAFEEAGRFPWSKEDAERTRYWIESIESRKNIAPTL